MASEGVWLPCCLALTVLLAVVCVVLALPTSAFRPGATALATRHGLLTRGPAGAPSDEGKALLGQVHLAAAGAEPQVILWAVGTPGLAQVPVLPTTAAASLRAPRGVARLTFVPPGGAWAPASCSDLVRARPAPCVLDVTGAPLPRGEPATLGLGPGGPPQWWVTVAQPDRVVFVLGDAPQCLQLCWSTMTVAGNEYRVPLRSQSPQSPWTHFVVDVARWHSLVPVPPALVGAVPPFLTLETQGGCFLALDQFQVDPGAADPLAIRLGLAQSAQGTSVFAVDALRGRFGIRYQA